MRRVVRHELSLISLSVSVCCEKIARWAMVGIIDLSCSESSERMDGLSYVDGWEERQNKHSRNA